MAAKLGMSHSRMLDEIGSQEFLGWLEFLLEPDKLDFYLAQIAWHIYAFEIRTWGVPKGEVVKQFKDFFVDRRIPKHSAPVKELSGEEEEALLARRSKLVNDYAKLSVVSRLGIPPPPPEVMNGR